MGRYDRYACCLFFFSSRRRHTRWPRDWSSDVCSSDLGGRLPPRAIERSTDPDRDNDPHPPLPDAGERPDTGRRRSEERRVGKSVELGGGRSTKKKKRNGKP